MKKRLLIVGLILSICIALPLTAMAIMSHHDFAKTISYQDKTLRYSKVEVYDVTEAFSIECGTVMVENRLQYTDEKGNTYIFLDDEILAYRSINLGKYSQSMSFR